jgi:hypothetical protein
LSRDRRDNGSEARRRLATVFLADHALNDATCLAPAEAIVEVAVTVPR